MLDPNEMHDRHPSTMHMAIMLRPNTNLKSEYRDVPDAIAKLAEDVIDFLPDSPELTSGLRKLLEAKDCFVRCAVLKDLGSDMNVDYRDH